MSNIVESLCSISPYLSAFKISSTWISTVVSISKWAVRSMEMHVHPSPAPMDFERIEYKNKGSTYQLPLLILHLHQGATHQPPLPWPLQERKHTSSMNLVTSYTFPLINNQRSSLVLCALRVSMVYGWGVGVSVDVDASAILVVCMNA